MSPDRVAMTPPSIRLRNSTVHRWSNRMLPDIAPQRYPGLKLILAIVVAMMLTVPLFAIYLLVYDRQHQSDTARTSIAQGWGGPQTLIGPLLAIPYRAETTTTETVDGKQVTKTGIETRELVLSPDTT